MRRLFTLVAALAIASAGLLQPISSDAQASAGPTPPPKEQCTALKTKWKQKQCQDYNNSAPGDEYFGRDKESYLGIENTFKDMAIEAGEYTTSSSIVTKLNAADGALTTWYNKYPHDPELARAYYLGVLAARKVYIQEIQTRTWQYIQTIIKHFPNTYFSKTMLAAVKNGFTEHWYNDAQPCPVPGVDPPSPTPTTSPKPGQPSIDLINPPCIQPATPEPSATDTASPSPAPKGHHNAPAPVVSNAPASPNPTGTVVPGPNPAPPLH